MGTCYVRNTFAYQVGEENMWDYCNYIYKYEGSQERFLITYELEEFYAADDERVQQMIDAVAGWGAERLNNQVPPDEQSTSQLPGGEPHTEVFQVTSLRQLRNQQQQDVNAAIVEIDKAADGSPYPNQLGMFETLSPEELNRGWSQHLYSAPFKKARVFPLWDGNMVLVKSEETAANKKPEVQMWFRQRNNVYKLLSGEEEYQSEYDEDASPSYFRQDYRFN